MAANPWMKFYPADWRSDQALRVCSLAARGLWMEMLCVMHGATPYGHLLINGSPVSDAQLAMLSGTPPDQIPALVGELESAGVFSRTGKGVIYSRRMTRDEKKAALARKNGKRGGNPSLCNNGKNPPPDKGKLNGEDNTQKPEARSQKVRKEDDDAGAHAREEEAAPWDDPPFRPPSSPPCPTAGPRGSGERADAPRDQDIVAFAVGERVAEIAGLKNDPNWFGDYGRVEVWLKQGYDPERDIFPAVNMVMARQRGGRIHSLKYFEQAIADHHKARTSPLPEGNAPNVHRLQTARAQRRNSASAVLDRYITDGS